MHGNNQTVNRVRLSKSVGRSHGKLLRGRIYDHNPNLPMCGGSIPTRFQRILMPPNTTLIRPNNRFDSKYFYKTLYNKEPGPGSYTVSTESIDTNPSISKSGYGIGFVSKNSKSMTGPEFNRYSELGPGKYNPEIIKSNNVVSKVFSYCGRKGFDNDNMLKLNIPFDEKNPLNYIKPIALNVYIKPNFPGPGDYNIKDDPNPNNMSEVPFKSGMSRMNPKVQETPGVGYYFIDDSNGGKKQKKIMKNSTKKSIKYDWLGDDADLVNKSYEQKLNKSKAEIVNYGKLYTVQKTKNAKEKMEVILENIKGESGLMPAFAISDMDRFGVQMRPKKPFEMKPGPADYDINNKVLNRGVSGPIFRAKSLSEKKSRKKLPPGPAFYNPQKEPDKLSFHLNVNKLWI